MLGPDDSRKEIWGSVEFAFDGLNVKAELAQEDAPSCYPAHRINKRIDEGERPMVSEYSDWQVGVKDVISPMFAGHD